MTIPRLLWPCAAIPERPPQGRRASEKEKTNFCFSRTVLGFTDAPGASGVGRPAFFVSSHWRPAVTNQAPRDQPPYPSNCKSQRLYSEFDISTKSNTKILSHLLLTCTLLINHDQCINCQFRKKPPPILTPLMPFGRQKTTSNFMAYPSSSHA